MQLSQARDGLGEVNWRDEHTETGRDSRRLEFWPLRCERRNQSGQDDRDDNGFQVLFRACKPVIA
jgi:hypothetical protein